jgi:hypothetical protein
VTRTAEAFDLTDLGDHEHRRVGDDAAQLAVPVAGDPRRRPLLNEPPREPRSDLLRRHPARADIGQGHPAYA